MYRRFCIPTRFLQNVSQILLPLIRVSRLPRKDCVPGQFLENVSQILLPLIKVSKLHRRFCFPNQFLQNLSQILPPRSIFADCISDFAPSDQGFRITSQSVFPRSSFAECIADSALQASNMHLHQLAQPATIDDLKVSRILHHRSILLNVSQILLCKPPTCICTSLHSLPQSTTSALQPAFVLGAGGDREATSINLNPKGQNRPWRVQETWFTTSKF